MGKSIFIQKKDFLFILHYLDHPSSLRSEHLTDGFLSINRGLHKNMFAYEFKEQESIAWLESQDWLLDFSKMDKLTIPEIQNLINTERELIVANFKNGRYHGQDLKITKDNFKLSSLVDFLAYKENRSIFIFPMA